MFAHSMQPSFAGQWNRVAPVAAALAVAFAFALSLIVLISAVDVSKMLYARAEADVALQAAEPAAVVESAPVVPMGG